MKFDDPEKTNKLRVKIESLLQFSLETRKPPYGLNQTPLYSNIEKLVENCEDLSQNLSKMKKEDQNKNQETLQRNLMILLNEVKSAVKKQENQEDYETQKTALNDAIKNLKLIANLNLIVQEEKVNLAQKIAEDHPDSILSALLLEETQEKRNKEALGKKKSNSLDICESKPADLKKENQDEELLVILKKVNLTLKTFEEDLNEKICARKSRRYVEQVC